MRIHQINLAATCNNPDFLKDLPLNEPILPHLNTCSFRKNNDKNLANNLIKNVIIGDNVILNCPIEDVNSFRHLKWFQNNKEINFNHNSKFNLLSNGSINIKSLMPNDKSIYTCRISNKFEIIYDLNVVGIVYYYLLSLIY